MSDGSAVRTALPLAEDGAAAPPRANGEIVFDAPWQSRAFGVAAALAEAGRLSWTDFQAALITEVGRVDAARATTASTAEPDVYWRRWLVALGTVTSDAGYVGADAWSARAGEFAARTPGHDHSHGHV
ncbi:MAG: nitrile hydratase accessory protein [Actinomycetota bacterium]